MGWFDFSPSSKCREFWKNDGRKNPSIWTVNDVRNNPNEIFVFGDNEERRGEGNQAIIRNEPNTHGIAVKKAPKWDDNAYWYDDDYDRTTGIIDIDIASLQEKHSGKRWVFPYGGMGTGMGKPRHGTNENTMAYLRQKVREVCGEEI